MEDEHPYLIAIKPLGKEFHKFKSIEIDADLITIGRGLENTVVIAHLPLSRRHCIIKKLNHELKTEWELLDMSSFGIEINGKKLSKGTKKILHHNDIIQLDVPGDFVYKFIKESDEHECPRKRMKLNDTDIDIIDNVKQKFEESQSFEIKHLETKILNAKQLQNNSMVLKQQLELDMARKIQDLQDDFALQIENLKGEKNEVEKQKLMLEEERDNQLADVKKEMEDKITELMEQIQKHNETASELLNENNSLKEKLVKEREEFLAELNRENSSKQDMLEQLEARIKLQAEISLKEKQELEDSLRRETDLLRATKEKELKDLEEQKRLRESELEQELSNMKKQLEEQISETEGKLKAEQELHEKMEHMKKLSDDDKTKMEQMLKEREEEQKKLVEAKCNIEKSMEELQNHVKQRETELATLASERIQLQADQSGKVITSLQEQLDKVRSQLESVETEKKTLLASAMIAPTESTSKDTVLAEFGNMMEVELQCSICAEMFVLPTTLNCSHTYCKYCISEWRKKKNECPVCRTAIKSECRTLALDSFIDAMVQKLPEDMRKKREEMLKDRQELEADTRKEMTANTRGGSRSESSSEADTDDTESNSSDVQFIDEYGGEEEEDYYDAPDDYDCPIFAFFGRATGAGRWWPRSAAAYHRLSSRGRNSSRANNTDQSGDYIEGLPGSYYGGYGECYCCGASGHWAPGCPFRLL